MRKAAIIGLILAALVGCSNTKERVSLDNAVAEVQKLINAGVQAGYVDPVEASRFNDQVVKGYAELTAVEIAVRQAKAAYEANKPQ